MTPQRLNARHPTGMMRQSDLPSNWKLSNQRLVKSRQMRSRAIEDYKSTLQLSSMQREVLVGLLLGDACLETQNRGHTYRLKIEQCARHEAYIEHLYSFFREWVRTPPRARSKRASNGSVTTNIAFQTVSHSA